MKNFNRWIWGVDNASNLKSLLKISAGFTKVPEVAAASATAIHAAITGSSSAVTAVSTSITDPDHPRVLKVTPGGTTADVSACDITITGTNVENKTITDTFTFAENGSTAVEGTKVFKTVTLISIPKQDGAAATFSIGATDKLGLFHRLYPNQTTVREITYYDDAANVSLNTSEPTVVEHEVDIEKNYVTPDDTPDGSTPYIFAYIYDEWGLNEGVNHTWSTSTSTSTSSTSSSTSSTSSSTSSTSSSTSSTSTSSTSSSTSSTSTSTTTAP